MGFLTLVDTHATVKVEHESGDYLVLRENLSKRELNEIYRKMPKSAFRQNGANDEDAIEIATGTAEALFGALVVEWSLDEPVSIDSYLALRSDAAAWVDGVLFEHLNKQTLTKDESGKQ